MGAPQAAGSPELFIGLMSGTSLDGVDAVLADFGAGQAAGGRALTHAHRPFPANLQAELLALNTPGGADELHRSQLAGLQLAEVYAAVVADVLTATAKTAADVTAIGVHGQTVRHHPVPPSKALAGYTVQLNNPALLAELTGIDVVADFRSRDLAAGGQGAPLAPGYHSAAFSTPGEGLAVLNLGGIANWTFIEPSGRVSAFDTGPASALMDGWIARHRGQAFDRDGAWAASGTVSQRLLEKLLGEPYFQQAPPKSTGRELINLAWLDGHLAALGLQTSPTPADVQATLLELTAQTVAQAWRYSPQGAEVSLPQGIQRVVVCGGGAFNTQLMRRLAALLAAASPEVQVVTSQALGVPPDQVEAMAFAWLAWRFARRLPGNLPGATGAQGKRVLGALYPA